jgi:hypothetical protein
VRVAALVFPFCSAFLRTASTCFALLKTYCATEQGNSMQPPFWDGVREQPAAGRFAVSHPCAGKRRKDGAPGIRQGLGNRKTAA